MECTIKFFLWSAILTVVLCSATLCEEVGTGNDEKDATSSLQPSSWNKFNDAMAEPPSCPDTWFVHRGNSCKCGETYYDTVSCDEDTKEVGVLDCYCMTFDSTHNATVLGACFYNCMNVTKSYIDSIYHNVPRDIASAVDNNSVCGYLYRTGTLCGQCIDGYYPAVYSYSFDCVPCNDKNLKSNWGIYVATAYLPLTVFIIFLFMFRVSVVSPKLNAIIFLTQTFVSPLNVRIVLMATKHNPPVNIIAKIIETVLGIWVLDFFRALLPGICLNINTLEVLALDYLIAVYPMLLMVIAYSLVELHGYGFRLVLYIWRPFHYFFARFRRKWDLRTSIIDTFVTFFILSTTRLLNVSFRLLMATELSTADGKSLGLYLYENASIKYFGLQHLPYGLLALAVVTLFIILPTCLLILYPVACCRKCLKRSKLKGRVLDEFVYAFHQYYKDGSDGSMDCRWFSAFYLLMKLSFFVLFAITVGGFFYDLAVIFTTVCVAVVIVVQPYKKEYENFNILDTVIMLLLALWLASITCLNVAAMENRFYEKSAFLLVGLVGLFSLVYLCMVTVHWLYHRGFLGFKIPTQAACTPDLPDRILHSREYGSYSTLDSQST